MHNGNYKEYLWFEKNHFGLGEFLNLSNHYFIGKYIAIVACDSGPYILSKKEIEIGWYLKNNILYTTKITDTDSLPVYESYNEWFIFDEQKEIEIEKIHVNSHIFLHNPDVILESYDSTWDKNLTKVENEKIKKEQEVFIKQIEIINPLFFVMDHDELIFICRDKIIFDDIYKKVSAEALW